MATQAQLNALDAAIASGELIIQYEGKRIEYRSITELMKARRFVADQLSGQSAASPGALDNRISFASFTRD